MSLAMQLFHEYQPVQLWRTNTDNSFPFSWLFTCSATQTDWNINCPTRQIKQVNRPARWTNWILICLERKIRQVNCSVEQTNWILIWLTRWIRQVNCPARSKVNRLNSNLPKWWIKQVNYLPRQKNWIVLKFTHSITSYWVTIFVLRVFCLFT